MFMYYLMCIFYNIIDLKYKSEYTSKVFQWYKYRSGVSMRFLATNTKYYDKY